MNGRDIGHLHDADLARRLPVTDDVGGGKSGAEVHRAADVLASEGALDPDGTGAVPVAARRVLARCLVAAIEVQHCLSAQPNSAYKVRNEYSGRELTAACPFFLRDLAEGVGGEGGIRAIPRCCKQTTYGTSPSSRSASNTQKPR